MEHDKNQRNEEEFEPKTQEKAELVPPVRRPPTAVGTGTPPPPPAAPAALGARTGAAWSADALAPSAGSAKVASNRGRPGRRCGGRDCQRVGRARVGAAPA